MLTHKSLHQILSFAFRRGFGFLLEIWKKLPYVWWGGEVLVLAPASIWQTFFPPQYPALATISGLKWFFWMNILMVNLCSDKDKLNWMIDIWSNTSCPDIMFIFWHPTQLLSSTNCYRLILQHMLVENTLLLPVMLYFIQMAILRLQRLRLKETKGGEQR